MPSQSFDNYDMGIRVGFACLNAPFVAFGIVGIVALNRTRKTPETARFLANGLIIQDIIAAGGFSLRKFISNDMMNILVQVSSINGAFLAYLTVAIMVLERLVLSHAPNLYLRRVSSKLVKTIAYVWILATLVFFSLRFLVCFLQTEDFSLYDVTGKCNKILNNMYTAIIAITIFLSIICYIKIFMIIKSEGKLPRGNHVPVKQYKTTAAVFMYLLIIILTSLGYLLLIMLNLSHVALRFGIDIIATANCILDPFVYVFWFREFRMEILKMFKVCLPRFPLLERRIEAMRIDIFHIS